MVELYLLGCFINKLKCTISYYSSFLEKKSSRKRRLDRALKYVVNVEKWNMICSLLITYHKIFLSGKIGSETRTSIYGCYQKGSKIPNNCVVIEFARINSNVFRRFALTQK